MPFVTVSILAHRHSARVLAHRIGIHGHVPSLHSKDLCCDTTMLVPCRRSWLKTWAARCCASRTMQRSSICAHPQYRQALICCSATGVAQLNRILMVHRHLQHAPALMTIIIKQTHMAFTSRCHALPDSQALQPQHHASVLCCDVNVCTLSQYSCCAD